MRIAVDPKEFVSELQFRRSALVTHPGLVQERGIRRALGVTQAALSNLSSALSRHDFCLREKS
jgi:hypothetical protein